MDLEDPLLLPCAIHRSVQATGKSVMSIELLSNIREALYGCIDGCSADVFQGM